MGAFIRDLVLDEVAVPCPCEGTPHEQDIVYIKHAINGMEHARIQGAMFVVNEENEASADVAQSNLLAVRIFVQDWTFVDEEGKRIPYDPSLCDYLRSDIWALILSECDKRMNAAPKERPSSGGSFDASTPISPLTSGSSVPKAPSPSSSYDTQDWDTTELPSSSLETLKS